MYLGYGSIFAGAMFEENNLILMVSLFCLALFIVGIGVVLLVRVGIIWESFAKLLQEGDYTKEKKERVQSLESSQQFIGYLLQLSIWQLRCLHETGRKDGSFGSLRRFYFRVFWQSQMYLRKTNHENDICSRLRTAS